MANVTLFLHIEKTGGISLRNLFESNFPGSGLMKLYGDAPAKIEDYKRLPTLQQEKIKVVCGHVDFGIHEQMGIENYRYVTLLRDPVERMISFYYYFIKKPSEFTTYGHGHKQDFKTYLESGLHSHVDNGQTRRLAGVSHLEAGACNPSHLERAKRNIENHIVVTGLLEFFEETLLRIKDNGILRHIFYLEANKSSQRPSRDAVPADVIDAIKKTNALDIQLYEFARIRFKKEIASQNPEFKKELMALKRDRLENQAAFQSFEKGVQLYRDGGTIGSQSLFQTALSEAGGLPANHEIIVKSWFYLGEIYREMNDLKSRTCYSKSLELLETKTYKSDEETYLTGSLLERLERFDEALDCFRGLLERSPLKRFTSGACFHMGEIYHLLGDRVKATEMMNETLRLNPLHRDARNYLEDGN